MRDYFKKTDAIDGKKKAVKSEKRFVAQILISM
jgi:hypothetical protein